MKKILYIILLSFTIGQECNDECACNYNLDSSSSTDCLYMIDMCGVCGGDNFNSDGNYCSDVNVLLDIILGYIPMALLGWKIAK